MRKNVFAKAGAEENSRLSQHPVQRPCDRKRGVERLGGQEEGDENRLQIGRGLARV